MSDYETVYTITDWYDGARGGIADFNGQPHYYENCWNKERDDWNTFYLLQPLDIESFKLAIEDWEIWLRWERAFKDGKTSHETHPTLPADRERHNELEMILAKRLVIVPETSVKAEAQFKYGEQTFVSWHVID